MTRGIFPKPLLFILLSKIAMTGACSSSTPALPPVEESPKPPKNAQPAALAFEKRQTDLQSNEYFNSQVFPIVQKCRPCHFKGGKMYAQLPFDNPKTIRHLGPKLFTRIQHEREQAVIRTFLAQVEDSTHRQNYFGQNH